MPAWNLKIVGLALGFVLGAGLGWTTRPDRTETELPMPLAEALGSAAAQGGGMTESQFQHLGLVAVVGGLLGLGLGYTAGRRGL